MEFFDLFVLAFTAGFGFFTGYYTATHAHALFLELIKVVNGAKTDITDLKEKL